MAYSVTVKMAYNKKKHFLILNNLVKSLNRKKFISLFDVLNCFNDKIIEKNFCFVLMKKILLKNY